MRRVTFYGNLILGFMLAAAVAIEPGMKYALLLP